jgi:hydroxymethylpyrimidine/phosphomethylpyrimidine kinase
MLLGTLPAHSEEEMLGQARALLRRGARAVLLKGGHREGSESVDMLVSAASVHRLSVPRLARSCRGTGCALATAIAASLGAGLELQAACIIAKDYVTGLLRRS